VSVERFLPLGSFSFPTANACRSATDRTSEEEISMAAPVRESIPDASRRSVGAVEDARAALLAELQAKAAERAELEARATSLTGQTDIDSLLERELAERGASRAQQAIGEIERALARMDLGTYGRCEACGGQVAPERLEAIPHARYCVTCSEGAPGTVA
jgi:DnaK suppressor protein